MPRKKLETPLEAEPVSEPTSEPVLETPTEESEAKRSYRDFIATYKARNPIKYAAKEKELLAKLDQIQ